MQALILAAGMASRLRPLTDTMPKCLLQIGERCLLQRAIDSLLSCGIGRLVIVTGYRHRQIEDFVATVYPDLDVRFLLNDVYTVTNNIYSLWLARSVADGEDTLLLDSDILFDPGLVARVLSHPAPDVLALNNHPLGEEEMKVVTDADGRILEINKTCNPSLAAGESIGIEKMSRAYTCALYKELEKMIIDEQQVNIFYERAFERLIPQGHSFTVCDVSDLYSVELDTVDDFMQARAEEELKASE